MSRPSTSSAVPPTSSCTDGYPSGLLGPIEGLIIPTRGQVIATEPIPERVFEVPHYGRHGFDYWHQAEDGRIVAGGFRDVSFDSEFTADEQLTEPVQRALHAFVNGLLGRELQVDYAWPGIFGMVMDFLPVVGRVPELDNVWVAGGYSGHGNVLGFACGELVAAAIAGAETQLKEDFQKIPGRRNRDTVSPQDSSSQGGKSMGEIRPFEFRQCISILKATGRKAKNLRELRQVISAVNEESIFHHTCQYFLKEHAHEYQ